jgi:hypothetical protein
LFSRIGLLQGQIKDLEQEMEKLDKKIQPLEVRLGQLNGLRGGGKRKQVTRRRKH